MFILGCGIGNDDFVDAGSVDEGACGVGEDTVGK
jgi:hypothetical protein